MRKAVLSFVKHLPAIAAIALIVVNALIDSGTLPLTAHVVTSVNIVLSALGIGVLHVRQVKN